MQAISACPPQSPYVAEGKGPQGIECPLVVVRTATSSRVCDQLCDHCPLYLTLASKLLIKYVHRFFLHTTHQMAIDIHGCGYAAMPHDVRDNAGVDASRDQH